MRAVVLTGTGGPEVLQVAGAARPAGRARARCGSRSRPPGSTSPTRWPGSASTPTRRSRPACSATRSPARSSRVGEGVDRVQASATASSPAPASAARPSWSRVPAEQALPLPDAAQLRAGRRLPGQLRHRLRGADHDGQPARGRPGADPRRRRRGRHLRHPDRPQRRRRDLRHRLARQARGDPRPGRRPTRSTTAARTSRRR